MVTIWNFNGLNEAIMTTSVSLSLPTQRNSSLENERRRSLTILSRLLRTVRRGWGGGGGSHTKRTVGAPPQQGLWKYLLRCWAEQIRLGINCCLGLVPLKGEKKFQAMSTKQVSWCLFRQGFFSKFPTSGDSTLTQPQFHSPSAAKGQRLHDGEQYTVLSIYHWCWGEL